MQAQRLGHLRTVCAEAGTAWGSHPVTYDAPLPGLSPHVPLKQTEWEGLKAPMQPPCWGSGMSLGPGAKSHHASQRVFFGRHFGFEVNPAAVWGPSCAR